MVNSGRKGPRGSTRFIDESVKTAALSIHDSISPVGNCQTARVTEVQRCYLMLRDVNGCSSRFIEAASNESGSIDLFIDIAD